MFIIGPPAVMSIRRGYRHLSPGSAPAHPVARLATGKTNYRRPVPTSRNRARPWCLCRRSPGNRRCSKVSISVIAVRGAGVGADAFKSRCYSMISISVGTGRGGGVCTGAVGSKHLNNVSMSPSPTKGAVTATMRAQFSLLAMNRSWISRSRAFGPISPNALSASVSRSIANIEGSSPSFRAVFSNWRR